MANDEHSARCRQPSRIFRSQWSFLVSCNGFTGSQGVLEFHLNLTGLAGSNRSVNGSFGADGVVVADGPSLSRLIITWNTFPTSHIEMTPATPPTPTAMMLCWSAWEGETKNTEHHDETENALTVSIWNEPSAESMPKSTSMPTASSAIVGHAADQHQSKIDDEQKRASDGHPSKNNIQAGDASETQQFQ